jgi:hypothetical protein
MRFNSCSNFPVSRRFKVAYGSGKYMVCLCNADIKIGYFYIRAEVSIIEVKGTTITEIRKKKNKPNDH